ncbi:MAG: hypothetical protein LBI27_04795 [Clostridiales bacterium]|jgi:hypothetical protein|nr:hypothetical protein [Clostridiales bacterium]
MVDEYEKKRLERLQLLDEMENWEDLQKALNKTLPNDGVNLEEIDYDKWSKGMEKFHNANKDLIMAMMSNG